MYSWIQLFGFGVMVYGATVYQGIVKGPFPKHESSSEAYLIEHETENLTEDDLIHA